MRAVGIALFAATAISLAAGAAIGQEWLKPPPFEVQRDVYWDFQHDFPEYWGPDDDYLKASDFMEWEGLDWFEGGVGINNSQGEEERRGWIKFHLDNWNHERPLKLIWLQYDGWKIEGGALGLHIIGPGGGVDWEQVLIDWHNEHAYTEVISAAIHPNPPWEEFHFVFEARAGGVVFIDNLRIATACVPEPGLLSVLGLGVLGIAARLKLRA